MKFFNKIFDKKSDNKINCWEYMKCGQEPGGKNAKKLGVCPAAGDKTFDGFNSGENSGRFCWHVAGKLFPGEEVKGTCAKKLYSCTECKFINKVANEEANDFIFDLNNCSAEKIKRAFDTAAKKRSQKNS